MVSLVAFDIDGTLTESKSLMTKEMGAALADLLTIMPVAIMSGGSFLQFEKQVLAQLPEGTNLKDLYLFPVSAGMCYRFVDGAWKRVYDTSFTPKEKKKVMDALTESMDLTGFTTPTEQVWGERIEDRESQITFSALGQQAPVEAKKVWDPDMKKRAPLQQELIKRLPGFSVRVNAATSIDITRDGVTKAYGVVELGKLSKIRVEDMLYVGDALFPGGNDAIVKETPIQTRPVKDPTETLEVIKSFLHHSSLTEGLKKTIRGEVLDDAKTLRAFSRDTSVFEVMPSTVVYPKDVQDVSNLVKAIHDRKKAGEAVSVTARAAGTCMSGGSLTHSVVAVFTKYINKVLEVGSDYAVTEPGVFYRDFEKETLKKNLILPSYPASRSIAAMGGIVNNNSGGERTLKYGKTERYVQEVEVVLSDGSVTTFKELTPDELIQKKSEQTLEGDIYRKMSDLIIKHREQIEAAEPHVSKNSAGYALWNVLDTENGTFNLAKLITGAQGTLALTTKMKLGLVTPEPYRAMLVIFLSDLETLPEIVHRVLPHNPESFESYDDHTFTLAIKFLPQMLSQMGIFRATRLGFSFLPEVGLVLQGGVPKLVLMAEFSEKTHDEALAAARRAQSSLKDLKLRTRIAKNEQAAEKYWIVRRESFALLRKNLKGLYAAPFIDDFVVPPDTYPEFLPRLNALLAKYNLIYTIAGHIGNGNFHIIPLMDLSKDESHQIILELAPQVYDLVIEYGGTTTGEHNDGIIRTPYLPQLFGEEVVKLFEETKNIFDPLGIFNPGKKVGGTFEDIKNEIIKTV